MLRSDVPADRALHAALVAAFGEVDGATQAAAAAAWAAGRAAWPPVALAPAALVATWQRVLADDGLAGLPTLHHGDLYLATAALAGDAAALRGFEADVVVPVAAALVRRGWAASDVDDVMQIVRLRMLRGVGDAPAKLATYRGRGALRSWLRVAATREAVARRPAVFDSLTDVPVSVDPVAQLLGETHAELVRGCLRAAVRELEPRLRAVLRMEVVERASHGTIAAIYGVHRTSVVRWLEEARTTLAREVRRGVARALAVPATDVDTLLRLAGARLELSLASLLASAP